MPVTNRPSPKQPATHSPIICYLDVETTGVDLGTHGIIQVSGRIEKVDRDTVDFDLFCRPQQGVEVSESILKWHGITREELNGYPAPTDTYNQLKNIFGSFVDPFNKLEKMHLVGYNAEFDSTFLRDFFEREGDKFYGSWFWHPPIDVMTLAGWHLMDERHRLVNFKLATVAAHMGIEVDQESLHDSLYDVSLTIELFERLCSM